jgi:hypothetical protein
MNNEFIKIKEILLELKKKYIEYVANGEYHPNVPITERDIVSEIYYRLKIYCKDKELNSHTEIKPVLSKSYELSLLKRLFRVDNVILKNNADNKWITDAIFIQNKYKKGLVQSRFSSIPIEYFHTAIEVKIQSHFPDSKMDIDKLKSIQDTNKDCNCFFVLLNARGKKNEHLKILEYANSKNIFAIEYTANKE